MSNPALAGFGSISEDPRDNQAEIDEQLQKEAKEQVLSKIEDQDPEYDEAMLDSIWCVEGDAKKEWGNLFRKFIRAHLDKKTEHIFFNQTSSEFIGIRNSLDARIDELVAEEANLILENE